MCYECRQTPCHPRCPNADDPPIACHCDICGEAISVGDVMFVIDSDRFCERCIDESRTYAEFDYNE
jgi:hypothetical protein